MSQSRRLGLCILIIGCCVTGATGYADTALNSSTLATDTWEAGNSAGSKCDPNPSRCPTPGGLQLWSCESIESCGAACASLPEIEVLCVEDGDDLLPTTYNAACARDGRTLYFRKATCELLQIKPGRYPACQVFGWQGDISIKCDRLSGDAYERCIANLCTIRHELRHLLDSNTGLNDSCQSEQNAFADQNICLWTNARGRKPPFDPGDAIGLGICSSTIGKLVNQCICNRRASDGTVPSCLECERDVWENRGINGINRDCRLIGGWVNEEVLKERIRIQANFYCNQEVRRSDWLSLLPAKCADEVIRAANPPNYPSSACENELRNCLGQCSLESPYSTEDLIKWICRPFGTPPGWQP
jgi:hypothetical protein